MRIRLRIRTSASFSPAMLRTTAMRSPTSKGSPLENGTFFEFSLWLSRACLGKMLIFRYKWLKKCRFLTAVRIYSITMHYFIRYCHYCILSWCDITYYIIVDQRQHSVQYRESGKDEETGWYICTSNHLPVCSTAAYREHTKGRQPACSCGIVRNRRCRIPVRQRISFLSIPYVCPEHVLVD